MTRGAFETVGSIWITPSRSRAGWPLLWNVMGRSIDIVEVIVFLLPLSCLWCLFVLLLRRYHATILSQDGSAVNFLVESHLKGVDLRAFLTRKSVAVKDDGIFTHLRDLFRKTFACDHKNVILSYDTYISISNYVDVR